MKKRGALGLAVSILICQSAGIIGSLFTIPAIETWWVTLSKPWFTPPGWVISVIWIILYTLMGISAFWIWKGGIERREVKTAVGVFGFQLLLNGIWTPVFFGLKNLLLGLAIIVALWFAILATIVLFYRISRKSGIILIPYLAWVTIATLLNYSVFLLN